MSIVKTCTSSSPGSHSTSPMTAGDTPCTPEIGRAMDVNSKNTGVQGINFRGNGSCKVMLHVLIALLVSTASIAVAENTEPMHFSVFWPCAGTANVCGHRILAEGVIERDTAMKFETFLAKEAFASDKDPICMSQRPIRRSASTVREVTWTVLLN